MNVFIKEKELDKSFLEHLMIRKSFEEQCTYYVIDALKKQLSIQMFEFNKNIISNYQLKDFQELGSFMIELKQIYIQCIDILEENSAKVNNEHLKEIFTGIKKMLALNIESISDNLEEDIVSEWEEAKADLLKRVELISKKKYEEIQGVEFPLIVLKESVYHIINNLAKMTFLDIEDEIKGIKEEGLSKLSQIDRRPVLKGCYDLLAEQNKTFDTIYSIENEMIDNLLSGDESEAAIRRFLEIINATRVKINHRLNEVSRLNNEEDYYKFDREKEINTIERIIDGLENNEAYNQGISKTIKIYQEGKEKILTRLYDSTIDEINKAIMFSVKEIENDSKGIQLLSFQIIEIIKELTQNISFAKAYNIHEDCVAIVKGIRETVALKLESLKERNNEYILDKRNRLVIANQRFLEFQQFVKENFDMYFDCLLEESKEEFRNICNKYTKLNNQIKAENIRHDMKYLKQELLFEMVTFEEIVNYALPKLKDCQGENVDDFILVINEAYKKINEIIIIAGIEIINPKPHDKFVGIKHEVLVAEASDEFVRGEIINVYTKGYSYQDKPVVRASVVVAK